MIRRGTSTCLLKKKKINYFSWMVVEARLKIKMGARGSWWHGCLCRNFQKIGLLKTLVWAVVIHQRSVQNFVFSGCYNKTITIMSGKKVSSDTCRNLILDVLDSKTSGRRLIARLLGRMMIGFLRKTNHPLGFGTLT